ncbi:hypothetical protein B296_00025681 [Ensete ventricosum]|uniref:C2 domain-containing protein n=1 Tax=Ensete ventricosum TaxID=4639 RepID=A0A426YHS1_ENSVE|nr:hypothetical protein B296_00025681 [Ensete ventricosum]
MGMNVIRLNELTPDEPKTLTLDLLKHPQSRDVQSDKSRGQIVVEALYKPFKEEELPKDVSENADEVEKAPDGTPSGGGLLVVIVHEAKDLEGKHHTNPYVRVTFRGEEKKTKLRHSFFFQESLGYVTISLTDVVNNKRTNETYHLIDSKNGRIQIELQWRTS